MRTTVTLDPDTENLIRETVRRSNRSFKQVLNDAIRKGLRASDSSHLRVEPLFEHPFPKSLGEVNFNQLAEELDDEEPRLELNR